MSCSLRADTVVDLLGRACVGVGFGSDLDLEVGSGERKLSPCDLQQHVGQDRKRMATFDNAAHGLQRQAELRPVVRLLMSYCFLIIGNKMQARAVE